MKRLSVFCGAHDGNNPEFTAAARQLAQVIVARNMGLVYGGASCGIMGVIADEVLKLGGNVIGVIPRSLFVTEVVHTGLTELVAVDSMHERKAKIYSLSDGFVALPGGLGTLDEIFEIMTWAQLGLHAKPYGFLNVAGYYDKLLGFLDHAVESGFVRAENRAMIMSDTTPEGLLQKFATFRPEKLPHVMSEEEI